MAKAIGFLCEENCEIYNCPVCGEISSNDVIVDMVDQTNGCECDYRLNNGEDVEDLLDKDGDCTCCAHERKFKIIGYSPKSCIYCQGSGVLFQAQSYRSESCCAKDDCSKCFGTGVIRMLDKEIEMACFKCKGRGQVFVERYDVRALKRHRYLQ